VPCRPITTIKHSIMKAIVLKAFGDTENFALEEIPNPDLSVNDILVRVKATAFNPIDYQMRRGANESKLLRSPILGRELAGDVIAVGALVTKFKTGDRVAAYVGSLASNGTYAEQISIPQQLVAILPDTLSYAEAAALPLVGLTALQCFQRLNIPNDEAVFIAGGAGGVGTILIKLLLADGHREIITTAGNTESRQHLVNIGIDSSKIVDYLQPAFINHLQAVTITGNYKYCIDLVGGRMAEICAHLLAIHGVYADITNLSTEKSRELLFNKAATIVNIANYAHALTGDVKDAAIYGKNLTELFNKITNRIISPAPVSIIGGLSVQTVVQAHALLEENNTKGKKLVMVVDEERC